MRYTVKRVAALSGVSVRTLHFYDEVGLLKPAYLGANGYRFYEEAQLLMLQQILFYRELGFELKRIKQIISRPDFDKIAALQTHRKVLRKNLADTRKLIGTIDRTIEHLKGKKKMKNRDMFVGFDPKEQARHEQYLVDRYGEGMKQSIADTKTRVKDWSPKDWKNVGAAFEQICKDMVQVMKTPRAADSIEAQEVIRRHYAWLKQFWTPNRESYAGHAQLLVDSELRKAYEAFDPQLPEFVGAAIKAFAEKELK